MIEGGLDTLDKVEAGELDADEVLEFGVKMGEEKLLRMGVVAVVVDVVVGVAKEDDDKVEMTEFDEEFDGKPVVAIGMSRTTLARVCKKQQFFTTHKQIKRTSV